MVARIAATIRQPVHVRRCMALLWLVPILLLQACATSGALEVARDQFRHGSSVDAMQTLSEARVSRRDRLLLYLDRGLIAQANGQLEASIAALDSAIRLVDELDYVSLRDQSSALVTSDWATRYRGEISERLWIHTFQMINFLLGDAPQSAAVEARRAAALYEAQTDVLLDDLFTRALMALSFEVAGQHASAQVEYRRLQQDFGFTPPDGLSRDESELVIFVLDGFIAPKLPGDLLIDLNARISFPYYPESVSRKPTVQVSEQAVDLPFTRRDTRLLDISRNALAERGRRIAARQALRIATKYQLSEAIGERDALAGNLAKLLLVAIDQADTRSWETLPAWLTLVRVPLQPGTHVIRVQIHGDDGNRHLMHRDQTFELELEAGQRHFQLFRTGVHTD